MKMNISFTLSSRYIMTVKLQSFSQTTFNCFAECCNEKCFVQDECHCELFDHCASRHSTYIYEENFFPRGVFYYFAVSVMFLIHAMKGVPWKVYPISAICSY